MNRIPGHDVLTHTRLTAFATCRRKHHFQYNVGVRREQGEAYRVGSVWHLGRDVLNASKNLDEAIVAMCNYYGSLLNHELDPVRYERILLEREKLIQLLRGWHWRWQDEPREVVASELPFNVALRNPRTNRASRTYRFAGKIDGIIALAGKGLAIEEIKTTGVDLSMDSSYWKALRLDAQISRYMLAARELGYPVETVMYDVARKPSIAPKLIKGTRETVEQYGQRLAEDIRKRPDFYFARVEIPRLESDLDEMRHELWQAAIDIRKAENCGHHYRNPAACVNRFTCAYLDVCSGSIDLTQETPDGFHRLTTYLHPELENVHASHDETVATKHGAAVVDPRTEAEAGNGSGVQRAHAVSVG